MPTDDRFLPQGKQILTKICQVRPMPEEFGRTCPLGKSFHLCRLKNHENSKPQPEKKTFSQIEEGRTSIY